MTLLSYLTVECRTNLDKTMFQEACATAHDTKSAVAGSRYYLLCEWLDMPPLNTAATDIDEVIILRKAKRLSANMRMHLWDPERRPQHRSAYLDYLACHPFQEEMFARFVSHIRNLTSPFGPIPNEGLEAVQLYEVSEPFEASAGAESHDLKPLDSWGAETAKNHACSLDGLQLPETHPGPHASDA